MLCRVFVEYFSLINIGTSKKMCVYHAEDEIGTPVTIIQPGNFDKKTKWAWGGSDTLKTQLHGPNGMVIESHGCTQ